MNSLSLKLAVLLLLGSCAVGPRIAHMDAPQKPNGANIILEIRQPDRRARLKREGELIEVRDEGVVVLLPTEAGVRLAFVPWVDIFRVRATELIRFQSNQAFGSQPSAKSIEEVRIVSRYPQGLSEVLMSRLLAFYGQQDLDTIAPARAPE